MNTYQLSISIRADDDHQGIDDEIRCALRGVSERQPTWDVIAARDRKVIYVGRPTCFSADEMDFIHGFNEFHNQGGSE